MERLGGMNIFLAVMKQCINEATHLVNLRFTVDRLCHLHITGLYRDPEIF